MKDGLFEAAHLGESRVDVQRVVVAAQAVQGSLVGLDVLLIDVVGATAGGLVGGGGGTAVSGLLLAVEAAGAADEDGHLVVEDLLVGLGVDGGDARLDDGGVALVDNLDEARAREEAARGGHGRLLDLEVLLAVQQHHGVEVGHDGVVAKGRLGGEGGDDTKGRQHLEVVGALEDVVELGSLGAYAQVVEDGVAVLVLELGRRALFTEGGLDGVQVLVGFGGGRGGGVTTLQRRKDTSN